MPFLNRGMGLMGGGAAGNGLLNNLIGYWPLNEAAGANDALDLHTNGLTLTQTHSPGSAAGKVYAGARTFDGANDYFSRDSETLLQTGDVDYTVAAWVYCTGGAGAYRFIVAKDSVANNREFALSIQSSNKAAFEMFVPVGITKRTEAADVLSLNEWHLLIGWHDSMANTVNLQVDALTVVSVATTAGQETAGTAPFEIADRVGSYKFPGRVGSVQFWKSAAGGGGVLSAAKIAALYNAGNGLAYAAFTA